MISNGYYYCSNCDKNVGPYHQHEAQEQLKLKCYETHCPRCGYDYDDPKFKDKHVQEYDSPDPYRNTNDLLRKIENSKWNPTPILDPNLLNEQMQSIYKNMEANIIAQKLCGECLKSRPEDIETLLKDGWNIVQKPMTSSMNNDTMQLTFYMEQWWLCKKCQENL